MDRLASEWSRIPSDKQWSVVMAVALTVIGSGMFISGMVLFATEGAFTSPWTSEGWKNEGWKNE